MAERFQRFYRAFLTKRYQFSLAILIPFFLVLFAVGPLVIASGVLTGRFGSGSAAIAGSVEHRAAGTVRLVMWVAAGAALVTGIVLSYSILAPVRRLLKAQQVPLVDRQDAGDDDLAILGRDVGAMMSSVSRHVAILTGMSGGVIAFDDSGTVTAVNPSAEAILCRRAEELLGRPLSAVCEVINSPGLERLILDGLHRGRAYTSEEVRIRCGAGTDVFIGVTTSLLTDAGGRRSGLVANFLDLTLLRRMHEGLQQRMRLASLGRLAAGVAHEVRNPLGAIKGMAQLLREGLDPADPRSTYAAVIEGETDRLNKVVEDLLVLAQGSGAVEPCDVNGIIWQARDLALSGLGGKSVTVLDETAPLPAVKAERGRLVQAFLNIVLNAFEAVPDGGTVRIRTGCDEPAGTVRIEISNTGPAIPAEVQQKMFDPFFTTKERGTGLGLAIAHQVITSHGGTITAESAGRETVFVVTLPVKGGE